MPKTNGPNCPVCGRTASAHRVRARIDGWEVRLNDLRLADTPSCFEIGFETTIVPRAKGGAK
jgi:hypothetical protein